MICGFTVPGMNAQQRRGRFNGLSYADDPVETNAQVQFVILPQPPAPELHYGVPEGPDVDRGNKSAPSRHQIANERSFGHMKVPVLQQIVRPSESGNHLGKALGGSPALRKPTVSSLSDEAWIA